MEKTRVYINRIIFDENNNANLENIGIAEYNRKMDRQVYKDILFTLKDYWENDLLVADVDDAVNGEEIYKFCIGINGKIVMLRYSDGKILVIR